MNTASPPTANAGAVEPDRPDRPASSDPPDPFGPSDGPVLIVGCGDVGTALGRLLAEGAAPSGRPPRTVWGLKRDPRSLPPEIEPLAADVTDPSSLDAAVAALPAAPGVVVYAVAASGFTDDAYRRAYVDGLRNTLDALGRARTRARAREGTRTGRPPGRFVFVSSTAVYGDSGGAWVDETTPPDPEGFSGRRVLEGERLLLDRVAQIDPAPAGGRPMEAIVVRFGGIYGPGRTRLIDRVRSGDAVCSDGPPVWTNRIHRDDCAGALAHLLALPSPESVYVGVDEEPAELCEVLRWIARRLGVPEPPRESAGRADKAGGANGSSRRGRGSKRCSSARLRASGYRFRFPTYREGYADLIAQTLETP